MIQGIYTASMGMTPLMQKQDQIANNLANINTTGFKQSGLFLKSYQKYLSNDQLQPFVNETIKADEVYVDYSEGALKQTNSTLDVAIKGSGFFTVMTDNGLQYTRNGNFSLSPEGLLVCSDGSRVMGTDGFIRVERDIPITISDKGEVIQRGESKGVLKITDFKKPYNMYRCGESRFRPLSPEDSSVKSGGFVLRQGYLEASNVDIIRNMVQMISTNRNFEADQKALHAQDESLEKAVNQVGRIG
ncbi:MAG TPA: flagellar basal-body rod protein FlgF [Chitinispirillaceae bacterium]|nr:flagellar basal-body rod protein FlgF [Chitinispirillaceae bacterium]